jgi:cobyrinic acid a,c-diamide synthase
MSNNNIPGLVVAGLRGGSGKTIVSLSLISLLIKKGLNVSPFKKGPDYIDAGWLARAAGTPCYNLDLFMMTSDQVLHSFLSRSDQSQISITEGNRGLYDGIDEQGSYSTAELAKLIKRPVIIAIDCTKTTSTIAAMILGCQKMDPAVLIGGAVLNRVATERQERVVRKAINNVCDIPVLGAIPRLKKDPFPERHMGLIPFQERQGIDESMTAVSEIGETYLDYEAIMEVAELAGEIETGVSGQGAGVRNEQRTTSDVRRATNNERRTTNDDQRPTSDVPRIGIIRDSAFQFYYQENFEELEKQGAELVEVSPLKDDRLPDIDALYIGGGFPETHAIALAANIKFKQSLHTAVEQGLPVYAECGGLMYLGSNIRMDDTTYPMTGILPVTFTLDKKPRAHGYTIVEVVRANPFFPVNTVLKGHEFHYSRVLGVGENDVTMAFNIKRGRGIKDKKDGMCYKNVFATYTHLHASGAPEWAEGMVKAAKEYRKTS